MASSEQIGKGDSALAKRNQSFTPQSEAPADQVLAANPSTEPNRFSYEYYQHQEDLTWQADSKQLQNLAWLLRMKADEVRVRAEHAGIPARRVTIFASFVTGSASIIALYGWAMIFHCTIKNGSFNAPQHLWQIGIITTAAVLLLAGLSTLLFNVAKQHYHRVSNLTEEMDFTRRIEAAVRLALSSGITDDPSVKAVFTKFGERLLDIPKKATESEKATDLSALPEVVKKVQEIVEMVTASAKGGTKGSD